MGLGRVESSCCRVSVRHNWSTTPCGEEALTLIRGDGVEGDILSGETLLELSDVGDTVWLDERGIFGYLRFEIGEPPSFGAPNSLSSSESMVSKDVKDATDSRDVSR